jgi:hypothetical protein
VEFLCKGFFPFVRQLLQAFSQIGAFQHQCRDLVRCFNQVDARIEVTETSQLCLKFIKAWLVFLELFVLCVNVTSPKPFPLSLMVLASGLFRQWRTSNQQSMEEQLLY